MGQTEIMTHHALFAPLTSRAVIAVDGPDWRPFLQGLLTQDVEGQEPGTLRFGGLLTPQGRLLYDLFILAGEEGCLLDVAAVHREDLIQRLSLYRLRAKITLSPSPLTVSALWTIDQDGLENVEGFSPDPRLNALGHRGFGVQAPEGASLVTEAGYQTHRLSLGVPDPALDAPTDTTYPIEANFDLLNGIDFKKGCFVGQETTSRMKRRGTIKTRMVPIRFEGSAPDFGAEILKGDLRAGTVLTGQEGRAMASVRLDRLDGSLSVESRPVTVDWPDWMEQTAKEGSAP
jgi:tRNA-modifying protein YgfZ